MDREAVREHAQAHCDALLAGDIGKAAGEMSKELQSSLGPIVAMLPMPMTEASIESIESIPTGYKVVLHLVGEGDSLRLETRRKDRDGRPTIVEASRVHKGPVVQARKRRTRRRKVSEGSDRGWWLGPGSPPRPDCCPIRTWTRWDSALP